MVEVVVARQPVDIGFTLGPGVVELDEVPASLVPEGAFRSVAEVDGRQVGSALVRVGQPVLPEHLVGEADATERATRVELDSAGSMSLGGRIDLLWIDGGRACAYMQDARITNITPSGAGVVLDIVGTTADVLPRTGRLEPLSRSPADRSRPYAMCTEAR